MKEITNVPANAVEQIVKDLEDEGCVVTARIKQADGNWTIKANCSN